MWRRVNLSHASRFLLHVPDSRIRVWRQRNAVHVPRNIQGTSGLLSHRSIMIWAYLYMIVNRIWYCTWESSVHPGYSETGCRACRDNHPLAFRLVSIDDKARPHRSHPLRTFLQNNAITTLPWPVMSSYTNLLKHIRDFSGSQLQKRDRPV